MTTALASSWMNLLTPPPPPARVGPKQRIAAPKAHKHTPEQKQLLALRICNQSFIQNPIPSDDIILERLTEEARLTKTAAAKFLAGQKAERGITMA